MARGGKRPGAGRPKKPRSITPQRPSPPLAETLERMLERRGKLSREDLVSIRQAVSHGWLHFDDNDADAMVDAIRQALSKSSTVKEIVSVVKTYATLRQVNTRQVETALKLADESHEAKQEINNNVVIQITQQQAELTALAADIRAARVVESVRTEPTRIDSRPTDGAG